MRNARVTWKPHLYSEIILRGGPWTRSRPGGGWPRGLLWLLLTDGHFKSDAPTQPQAHTIGIGKWWSLWDVHGAPHLIEPVAARQRAICMTRAIRPTFDRCSTQDDHPVVVLFTYKRVQSPLSRVADRRRGTEEVQNPSPGRNIYSLLRLPPRSRPIELFRSHERKYQFEVRRLGCQDLLCEV